MTPTERVQRWRENHPDQCREHRRVSSRKRREARRSVTRGTTYTTPRQITIDDPLVGLPYTVSRAEFERNQRAYLDMGCRVLVDGKPLDVQEILL